MKVRSLLSDNHEGSTPYNKYALDIDVSDRELKPFELLKVGHESNVDNAQVQASLAKIKLFDEKAKQDQELLQKAD